MAKDEQGYSTTRELVDALEQIQDVFPGLAAARGIDGGIVPPEEILAALRLQAGPTRRDLIDRILGARDLLNATRAKTAGVYCELNGILELHDRLEAKARELAEEADLALGLAPKLELVKLPDLELERPGMLDRIRARLYRLVIRQGGRS